MSNLASNLATDAVNSAVNSEASNVRQTMIVSMENQAGALSNLVGLFAQRAINIQALTVLEESADNTLSTLTITATTPVEVMASLAKQVDRLVDVITVEIAQDMVVSIDVKAAA